PIDEIEHAMMGASEVIAQQQPIRIADEVAIGEKEQFDQVEHRLLRDFLARVGVTRKGARRRVLVLNSVFHSRRPKSLPGDRPENMAVLLTYFRSIASRQVCCGVPK